MIEPNFGITQFVRGMAWHDVGKPFALGTAKHAALGYWLLSLADYKGEALVALAHGHTSKRDTLSRYFWAGGKPLPGILTLCNSLDRLSASVYSLQSRGTEEYLRFHSLQNPFSRLCRSFLQSNAVFNIFKDDLGNKVEQPLWTDLLTELPPQWQHRLTYEEKTAIEKSESLPSFDSLPAGADALRILRRYMDYYPERTYPAVNDTSLTQHCRLSGILAFIVYRNIERKSSDLLNKSITFSNNDIVDPIEDAPTIIREHLTASLVRVTFKGHRSLYEKAVRVDDLNGARQLTDLTREAFKRTLADKLDVPDLANFLTISESQFDLVYLLPTDESLAKKIDRAYQLALEQVAGTVLERLEQDFPQISDQKKELERQLLGLVYGFKEIAVSIPPKSVVDFNQFAADYGNNLFEAYKTALKEDAAFPKIKLSNITDITEHTAPLLAKETCQVCGNYRILTPPDDLPEKEKAMWQTYHDYAGHVFRENRERLCLSCVARRTLAYGAIAKNNRLHKTVHDMLKADDTQPGLWRGVPATERDGPALPPLLQASVKLTGKAGELIERGAFFVRCRGKNDCSELDIFPTTSYAADATGNLILLALRPTETLFACFPYSRIIVKIKKQQEEDLVEYQWLKKSFVDFHDGVKERDDKLAGPIRYVQPHLARVMERIERIKQFYETLWHALNDAKLRVLPLDLDYPTLRLLVPADDLDTVLRILDQVMTETLFSAIYKRNEKGGVNIQDRQRLHNLLALLIPNLLHGIAILFKHKYPLYLALEAERDLFRQLEESEPDDDPDKRTRPNNGQWYGLRLAFSDLRGTLSEVAPMLAEVTYADLGTVIDLAQRIDRRTITGRTNIVNTISLEPKAAKELTRLADDLFTIRADRQGIKDDDVETLLAKNGKLFKPVHFIKTAMRE